MVRITNPKTSINVIKSCIFDTGFTGYFGLDDKILQDLNLKKISQGKGYTVFGAITYDNYLCKVEILKPDKTPIKTIKINKDEISQLPKEYQNKNEFIIAQKFDIPLIGMRAIIQFNWLIIKAKKIICMIQ